MGFDTDAVTQPRVRSQSVGGNAWQQGLTPNFGGTSELAAVAAAAPIVQADIDNGTRLYYGTAATEEWRVARVQMYVVPPATEGPSGRPREFHRDYRHYKYYGFGGKGAKTSWAHNPKYSVLYEDEPVHYRIATLYSPNSTSGSDTHDLAAATVLRSPLRDTMDGPIRQLTPVEKQLVREFRMHSYAYDGQPSVDERSRRGGGQQLLGTGSQQDQHPSMTGSIVSAKQLHKARQHGALQQHHQQQRLQHHHHQYQQQQYNPAEATLSFGMHDNMYGTVYR